MESFIKKTEVNRTLVKFIDTSDASQINTIKIIYCPPTFPSIFDAKVGLAFVIPPDLTNSVKDLCKNQLNITPDIQNGELLLDVSLDIKPPIFSTPLKVLNAIKENGHITEAFRQKISKEYTDILIETLHEKEAENERNLKSKAKIILINGKTTINTNKRRIPKVKKQPIDQPNIEEEKNTFTPLFQPPPRKSEKEKTKSLNNSPRKEN